MNDKKPYKRCPCGEVIDDAQTYCSDECADMPALKRELSTLREQLAHAKMWEKSWKDKADDRADTIAEMMVEANATRTELSEVKMLRGTMQTAAELESKRADKAEQELSSLKSLCAAKDEALRAMGVWLNNPVRGSEAHVRAQRAYAEYVDLTLSSVPPVPSAEEKKP